MTGKKLPIIILAAFVLGTLMLIYAHYIFSKNNDALIKGNEKLLSEVKVNSQLRGLEKAVIAIERTVRGTIVNNDASNLNGLEKNIAESEADLDQLQKISDDDSSVLYIDELDTLVQKKFRFSNQILDTFHHSGKPAGESMLNNSYGESLTDSIVHTLHKIDITRKKHFDDINNSIKINSNKAQRFITLLIACVLAGVAVLFWFIIITIRRQVHLINQLNISEKKVRETAHVKEKFLANMSHEIRTPMNAILGFTNLLQRKTLDEESKEYVETIQKSGEGLLTIINDILDLSKIEAGMMRIESAPFNIRDLAYSVEALFSDKAKEKEIELFLKVDKTLPKIINGDANRLTQILVNIIGNALKFTEEGSISIQITNEGIIDNIVNTGITITDTGIGIEPEKLEKIFDRFQQADDAVTRKYGGTGLGLAIVNDLIQLQKGSIKVESKLSKGTTFRIIIPYRITMDDVTVSNSGELNMPVFTDAKILVVEDNEINQSLIKHLFKIWNLDYDMVNNGKEAIEILQTKIYNLVLMDIQMPVMDGYSAAREIRQRLKLNIPLVAMTAHAFAGEREKCLSYGFNEYISKPIREDQLHNMISRFLQNIQPAELQNKHIEKLTPGIYKYIQLDYMKEISAGNLEYEKTVTEQFIEAIPQELNELKNALQNKDLTSMRSLAHNMKTTISVMGLNEKLQSHLDALEYETLSDKVINQHLLSINLICTAALAEAKILIQCLSGDFDQA